MAVDTRQKRQSVAIFLPNSSGSIGFNARRGIAGTYYSLSNAGGIDTRAKRQSVSDMLPRPNAIIDNGDRRQVANVWRYFEEQTGIAMASVTDVFTTTAGSIETYGKAEALASVTDVLTSTSGGGLVFLKALASVTDVLTSTSGNIATGKDETLASVTDVLTSTSGNIATGKAEVLASVTDVLTSASANTLVANWPLASVTDVRTTTYGRYLSGSFLIWKPDGTLRTIIHLYDKAEHIQEIMGDDYIRLNFTSHQTTGQSYIEFEIGDYTVYPYPGGVKYYINTNPNIKKKSSKTFIYDVSFEAVIYDLGKVQFLTDSGTTTTFDFIGNADDFLDEIITNLNRVYGSGEWTKGSTSITDERSKLLHFESESCLNVLRRISREFNCEYEVESTKTINLKDAIGAGDTGETLEYRSGLFELERKSSSSKNIITRLFAYGSSRNINGQYFDDKNLDKKSLTLRLLPTPSKNLLDNTSFPNLTDWTQWGSPSTRESSNEQAYIGTSSYKHAASNTNAGSFQTIDCDESTEYTVSVWCYATLSTDIRIMTQVDGDAYYSDTPSLTAEWERLEKTITTAAGQTSLTVWLGGNGACYFDAAQVEKRSEATAYRDGEVYYVEKNVDLYGVIEGVKVFDDIYPSRTGTISSVDGSDETKFTDDAIDFDVNSYLIDGLTPKVHFQTGNLAGYAFDIFEFTPALPGPGGDFTIMEVTDEFGDTLPSGDVKPAFDNTYVLIDIAMPDSYITAAEDTLLAVATDHVDSLSELRADYNLLPDNHYFKVNTLSFDLGDKVTITDTDLDINELKRIVGLVHDLIDEYKYKFKFSDYVEPGIGRELITEIEEQKNSGKLNREHDVLKARGNWRTVTELQNMTFDTDGYFSTDNYRPLSIETLFLSVGGKSGQFTLNDVQIQANYAGNEDGVAFTAGGLTHFALDDDDNDTIGNWVLSANNNNRTGGLITTTAYYIYAKCNKTNYSDVANRLEIQTTAILADSDATYYYFLVGYLHSTTTGNPRAVSLTYGFTTINGGFITTGKIQSSNALNYFDLDNNTFYMGDGASQYLEWDGANLTLTGTITAEAGEIGGWTIESNRLESGGIAFYSEAEKILIGSAITPLSGIGIFLGKDVLDYEFRAGDPAGQYIHWDGSDLTISGSITATTGTIGGWAIQSGGLLAGNIQIESVNNRILMGLATAPMIGTGVFLGKDVVDYEFRAGDPAGQYIHWDGTDLTISGSVTAESGEIGGWDILAGEIGSGNVHLQSTNERMLFGAATGATIGTGVFIGLSGGLYKFRAGDPSGNNILWDGSTLSIDGRVTATTGAIGGWTLMSDRLYSGSFNLYSSTERMLLGSAIGPLAGTGVFLGKDGSDYEFRAGNPAGQYIHWDGTDLTISGSVTAESGEIGGWAIMSDHLYSGSFNLYSSTERMLLGAAMGPLSGVGIFLGKDGSDYEFRAGNPARKYIHWDGSALTVNGGIVSDIQEGSDITILGWSSDLDFQPHGSFIDTKVQWGLGEIRLLDNTIYSIDAGQTGVMTSLTYIYFDTAFPTTLQTTTTASVAVGKNKILVAVAQNGNDVATVQAFGGKGGVFLAADNIAADSLSTNEFVANTANISDLIVTDAKITDLAVDKLTAGSITSEIINLAVTPGGGDVAVKAGKSDFGDSTSGFILGIDDSYSDTAKFEIGNGSNYLKWDGSALEIRGSLNASDIGAGTLTGLTVQTDSSGQRIVLDNTNNALYLINSSNVIVGRLDDDLPGVFLGPSMTLADNTYGAQFVASRGTVLSPSATDYALMRQDILTVKTSSSYDPINPLLVIDRGIDSANKGIAQFLLNGAIRFDFQSDGDFIATGKIVSKGNLIQSEGSTKGRFRAASVGGANPRQMELIASDYSFHGGAIAPIEVMTISGGGNIDTNGFVDAGGGFKDNGTAGADGTITLATTTTITVSGGIITGWATTP